MPLRAARWGLRQLTRRFPIETLYRFNRKFGPGWQPRYLACEAAEDLPSVAVAALRAEGLLTRAWSSRWEGFRTVPPKSTSLVSTVPAVRPGAVW